ncbi:MAG: YggS family pyridoxal phosphate-dependent enzyme [Lachnospiraceae bacterium]|nr:YggS family pyridoxal phosphate-dependent enzyme [Lachnospiraceae bacterium]
MNVSQSVLKENYANVLKNVHNACERAGRKTDDVTLIAVSKTKPVEMLQEIYDCGCRDFGENKVQEIMDKYEKLPNDIRWHMIGHLQTNKVKYIVDKVYMIHSVDSIKLAKEISKEAVKKNVTVKVLLEVNVAKEETKFGLLTEEVLDFYKEVIDLPGLKVCGLMTIAPYVENSEENRQHFVKLKQLMVDIESEKTDNISVGELSMGMTGDYEVAIEEGATYVRVGTGIFGERNYNI